MQARTQTNTHTHTLYAPTRLRVHAFNMPLFVYWTLLHI